jgi:hypothetical protein
MSTLPDSLREELGRVQRWSFGLGAGALLLCVLGAFFSPAPFLRAYLAAYQFYLGIGLGCLAILMIYHLTGGAWGFLIRHFLEAGAQTLPLLALLFLPVALGVTRLYPWAQAEENGTAGELEFNHTWLVPWFWLCRAAVIFLAWLLVTWLLSRWSRQQDQAASRELPRKFRLLSAPGLIIYGLAITIGSVDWMMSLQPAFHSTIFGVEVAVGQILSGLAFVILILARLVARPPLAALVSMETLNDLGNLLLSFLVIWAYLVLFEFLLIWMGNLPEEISWYLPRSQGGWQWVAWALFLLHFAVPFFCLLMRDIKRDARSLARVAGLILFMHLVFLYYQVMPAFPGSTIAQHWMDFLTPLGVGGLWLASYLWQLARRPILPLHDSNQAEAVRLRQLDLEATARTEAIGRG